MFNGAESAVAFVNADKARQTEDTETQGNDHVEFARH